MLKSKNKYLRFAVNAILFLLLIIVLDQIFGRTLRHYYFTSTSGDYYRTTYAMDSTKAEIIILGSSRASHHNIPQLIEDSSGMSCYNTGRDGNFLLFSYAVFNSIVKRYNPKIIILDINPSELYQANEAYEGLASLLPYYNNKPELQNIIKLRSKVEKYKMLSAIYPFNSNVIAIGKGNLGSYNDNKLKGYLPLHGTTLLLNKPKLLDEGENKLDINKLNAIDSMALICLQKSIRFIIVQSPRYADVNQKAENQILLDIMMKYNGFYYNLVNESMFINNPALFRDSPHLNDIGAQLFTQLIIQKIKYSQKVNIRTQLQ